jgi:hypothetical protein
VPHVKFLAQISRFDCCGWGELGWPVQMLVLQRAESALADTLLIPVHRLAAVDVDPFRVGLMHAHLVP